MQAPTFAGLLRRSSLGCEGWKATVANLPPTREAARPARGVKPRTTASGASLVTRWVGTACLPSVSAT